MRGVSWRISAPKIIYSAIIFSIALQPLLIAPAAYALDEPDIGTPSRAVVSAPTSGLPNAETKLDTSFSFTWVPSVDESATKYQLRISRDKTQVGDAPDLSLAWYSSSLTETNLLANTIPNLEPGMWYWQVRAMDVADNKSAWSEVWTVMIDASGPIIEISRPLQGELLGMAALPFNATVVDTGGLVSAAVELDGRDITAQIQQVQTETTVHLHKQWQPQELADGNHTLRIIARDTHGHTSDSTRSFVIDTIPPQITTGIEEGQALGGMVSLGLVANEMGTYTIRIVGNEHELLARDDTELQTASATGHTRVWNTGKVADGKYTIVFTGRDTAGNESAITRQVTVANVVSTGVVAKDPLLEELSASLNQPLVTPRFTTATPQVAPSSLPMSSDLSQPQGELLDAAAEFTPVAATENGWLLFGILWYWWMLSGLLLAGSATYAWRLARVSFEQMPGSL